MVLIRNGNVGIGRRVRELNCIHIYETPEGELNLWDYSSLWYKQEQLPHMVSKEKIEPQVSGGSTENIWQLQNSPEAHHIFLEIANTATSEQPLLRF